MPVKKSASDSPSKTPKTTSRTPRKPREKTAAQKARDEERRKMLAAKKLEMKARMQQNGAVPDIIMT